MLNGHKKIRLLFFCLGLIVFYVLVSSFPAVAENENGMSQESTTQESNTDTNELNLQYNPEDVESEAKSVIEKAKTALNTFTDDVDSDSQSQQSDNSQEHRNMSSRIGQIIFGLILVGGGILYFKNKKRTNKRGR